MKKNFVFMVLFLTTSCAARYYAPNQHNVPLFQNKGEFQLSAAASGGNDVSAIEIQGAYAVTGKLGIMANALAARASANSGSHGFLLEGGAGYFRRVSKRLVFETYAGAGAGQAFNRYGTGNSADLRFTKIFAQPDFGFTSRYIDAAVSNRFTSLHYTGIDTVFSQPEMHDANVDYIKGHRTSLLTEPGFILRAGPKFMKLQLQLSTSFNLTAPQLQQENAMFGMGVYFSHGR